MIRKLYYAAMDEYDHLSHKYGEDLWIAGAIIVFMLIVA